MPRKKKEFSDSYGKAFPSVLRLLMDRDGTTQQMLATQLGKTRQSISCYCDGSSSPDWETLAEIAKYFSISADYLLGLSNDPQRAPSAVDDLGLSPKAVQYLRILHEQTQIPPYDTRISLLSYLFENRQFDYMLALCERYVRLMGIPIDSAFEGSSDYIACSDFVKSHGYEISTPEVQANALFSERITNLLRTILDERVEHTGGSQATSPSGRAGTPADAP